MQTVQIIGIITEKQKVKIYQGQREGQFKMKLKVKLENNPTPKLLVFQDKLASQAIWTALEENEFLDKRYLFTCQNYFGQYHLLAWEELPNLPVFPKDQQKELLKYE